MAMISRAAFRALTKPSVSQMNSTEQARSSSKKYSSLDIKAASLALDGVGQQVDRQCETQVVCLKYE